MFFTYILGIVFSYTVLVTSILYCYSKIHQKSSEASLIIPEFLCPAVRVQRTCNNCNILYFGLILSSFLFQSISLHLVLLCGCQLIERESKRGRMDSKTLPAVQYTDYKIRDY